jgi:hypothetical protein
MLYSVKFRFRSPGGYISTETDTIHTLPGVTLTKENAERAIDAAYGQGACYELLSITEKEEKR